MKRFYCSGKKGYCDHILCEDCEYYDGSGGMEIEMPADVVEVVRCKDCEHSHWEQEPCHGKTEYYCPKLESKVDSHFYCALGNKKEGIKK